MEMRAVVSLCSPPAYPAFPLAIRARLSNEDSGSDESPYLVADSDDSANVDDEEEEVSHRTVSEDGEEFYNSASFTNLTRISCQPSMPIARVTGDDDDDVLDLAVFDEEGEQNAKLPLQNLAVESSNLGEGYVLDGRFVCESEDSGFSYGGNEKDNHLIFEGSSVGDTDANEGEMDLMDVTIEMETVDVVQEVLAADTDNPGQILEKVLHYDAVVNGKVGVVSSGHVKQNFDMELNDADIDSNAIGFERINVVDGVDSPQKTAEVVKQMAEEAGEQSANARAAEAEHNTVGIVGIGIGSSISLIQKWNEEFEPKATKDDLVVSDVRKGEVPRDIDSMDCLDCGKPFTATKIDAEKCEHTNIDCRSHHILEILDLPAHETRDTNAIEFDVDIMDAGKEKNLNEDANFMESEIGKGFAGKVHILDGKEDAHGSCPNEEIYSKKSMTYPEKFSSFLEGKHHDFEDVDNVVCTMKNESAWAIISSDCISLHTSEKEVEPSFDGFHVVHVVESGEEHVDSEYPTRAAILDDSETVRHILEEGDYSCVSHSVLWRSMDNSHVLDGEIISNSNLKVECNENSCARESFDISSLAELLRDASCASNEAAYAASQDVDMVGEMSINDMNEEEKLHFKVEQIKMKYLCLAQRLGHSLDNALPDHVLRWIDLVEAVKGRSHSSKEFILEVAKKKALQLEVGKDDFSFSCNILVLGKTGVGKSATINSIFGDERASTNPFEPATSSIRNFSGFVDGVYICVVDTPGLSASLLSQGANRKILSSIKKYTRRCPPDVVLYVDRLDIHAGDLDELPLLRMITNMLGSSIWFNAIIAFTHASSALPEGPDGFSLSYDAFVAQRCNVVQQSIRQATGDVGLLNLATLVENCPNCSGNKDGESLLPNGLRWKPQLLLLCYSLKLLLEVSSLLNLDIPSTKMLFAQCPRRLLLFLCSLLQTSLHPMLSPHQGSNNDCHTVFDGASDGLQQEDGDQLPHFKPLRKSRIEKLAKEKSFSCLGQKDYYVKLLQKKFKHYEDNCSALAMYNIQPVGMRLDFTQQGMTKFKHFENNEIAAGISATFFDETMVNGLKLEHQLVLGKQLRHVHNSAMVRALKDVAYGSNLDIYLMAKDSRMGQVLCALSLSLLKWPDFALGAYLHYRVTTGRKSKMAIHVELSNRSSGQITIKPSPKEQLHVALVCLCPIALSILRACSKWGG